MHLPPDNELWIAAIRVLMLILAGVFMFAFGFCVIATFSNS
jgi:hypothetical protein